MERERTARGDRSRPSDGDAFVAHAEDIQPRLPDQSVTPPRLFEPDLASIALGKAMQQAQEPWLPGPTEELDADLSATIDAMAGRDWREKRRLIAGAKRYPVVREQLRNAAARSRLATSAPDFTPLAGRPRKPE